MRAAEESGPNARLRSPTGSRAQIRRQPPGGRAQQQAGLARQPSLAILGDAAARHDHVDMGVMGHGRAPGVERGGDADAGVQVLAIGRDRQHARPCLLSIRVRWRYFHTVSDAFEAENLLCMGLFLKKLSHPHAPRVLCPVREGKARASMLLTSWRSVDYAALI
jgi:hypothetical protein